MLLRALLVVFVVIVSSSVYAEDGRTALSGRALVEKSGLSGQLKQLPALVEQQIVMLEQQNGPMPSDRRSRFMKALTETFEAEGLISKLSPLVEQKLSSEDRKAILDFLDSPLGRKVMAAENAMNTPEAMAKLEADGPKLMEALMKDHKRLALIQSINQATHATDVATDIAMAMAIATEYGLISQSDAPQKPGFDEVKAMYQQQRLMMKMQTAQMVLAGSAVAYRDLSDAELTDYLTFANSDVGQRYFVGVGDALIEVLTEAAHDFGRRLGEAEKPPV